MDPQGNATSLMMKTQTLNNNTIIAFEKTLMSAIADNDLQSIVTNIMPNLYLLPSYADFTSYPRFAEELYKDNYQKRVYHFKNLLENVVSDFDFVIFDVPPTVSLYLESALISSSYAIIVMQTQEWSLDGAKTFDLYLDELSEAYKHHIEAIGVMPVLIKNRSQVEKKVLNEAHDTFGKENVFNTIIRNMERIKRYSLAGISDPENETIITDIHDRRAHKEYMDLTKEILKRVEEY
jgi:cellulose biosynthesis protein BcsQ